MPMPTWFQSPTFTHIPIYGNENTAGDYNADPDTDILSYQTLVYNRATGNTSTRLIAQTDKPYYQVADWPTTDVAFSLIDDVLTLYPTAPANASSFAGVTHPCVR